MKNEASHITYQLEVLSNQYTLLEAESNHTKQHLDAATTELAETKGKLSVANTELDSAREEKGNMHKQVERAQQQLEKVTNALAKKVGLILFWFFLHGHFAFFVVCR